MSSAISPDSQQDETKQPVMDKIPRFYMYDIARGAYLRPDALREMLRHAARCHFTHFIPYLENMIDLPSMTKGACRCAYTQQDWESFQKTAEEAGIELVPHFNVIGHSNKICRAYPELTGRTDIHAETGADGKPVNTPDDPFYFSELDPTTPTAQQWMLRCLQEFCSFSKSEYFLIGGDEWNAPQHLLARKDTDAGRVWCDYINLAVDYLVSQNRTPIIWHDMLVHYPHVLERLSRKAVVAFWFYDFDTGYPFLGTLKKFGFRTIMAAGLCAGALSQRRERGLHCAMRECVKYQADAFMVTTWSDGRWERQIANVDLCGKMLDEGKIPSIYPETVSTVVYLQRIKNAADEKKKSFWQQKLNQLLADPAWTVYPEYRDLLKATVENDMDFLRKTYAVHHYPEGPLYDTFQQKTETVSKIFKPEENKPKPVQSAGFGIELIRDAVTGNTIRFRNGSETFVLYPDYGAKLADWRIGGNLLVPNKMPDFLKKNPNRQPGSYKSYDVAAFSPAWDIGTHLNPNIIWSYPWEFQMDASNPEEPAVEMFHKFTHAEIRYRVSMKKGVHGFRWNARVVNLLPHIQAAFGWNFLLTGEQILDTEFLKGGDDTGVTLLDFCNELPVFECSTLILKNPNWNLTLETPPEKSAGFWIDWGKGWMTPDLHGKYQPLAVGETYETEWNFILEEKNGK